LHQLARRHSSRHVRVGPREGRRLISTAAITLAIAGDNPVRFWGLTNAERIRRLARAAGVATDRAPAADDAILWADTAFAFDPAWFAHIVKSPATVLMSGGRVVLANLPAGADPATTLGHRDGLTVIDYDMRPILYNHRLRKRECPFVEPLTADTAEETERRSYYGAYKGVTDILTKYLWPEIALGLTRVAARLRMTPNMVSFIGIALCIAATFLFAGGWYWTGLACGFLFMILDTVDGKLARCTVTSSWWGNIIDHGVDIVHPPFWWFAWGWGTTTTAHPLTGDRFVTVLAMILGSYALQRLIEGIFMRRFGMHIHVWRKFDTDFRLITARRNPNMVILFVSLAAGRPDLGLVAVAWWAVASLLVHVLQLVQAYAWRARHGALTSWMEQTA
jgi:phosphatidylglycerophosphate synthase